METLFIAFIVIGGIIGAGFAYLKLDSFLENVTGRDIGGWIETLWVAAMLTGIGFFGVWLINWGMTDSLIVLTIFGLLLAGVGFIGAFSVLKDGTGGYPDSMSGKTKHFNSDGNLRGYSDKE